MLYHEFICKERARNRGIKERRERESNGLWGMVYTNLPTSQRLCCCSVAQSCPTLCYPMDCSTPCFPVLHHLLELVHTHVLWICNAIQLSHSLSSPSPPAFYLSQHKVFPMSQLFASGGQSIRASTSVSVLPMNIQGWFPLGLTGLIALLSKELSRVFSSTSIHDYWKNHRFD